MSLEVAIVDKAFQGEHMQAHLLIQFVFCNMAATGYSGTPLLKKLGIKPGMKVLLINEPGNYYNLLGADISDQLCPKNEIPDLVHFFAKSRQLFESTITDLQPIIQLNPFIAVWVSWYKKSAKIPTNITEDSIRRFALSHGLVDIKVCAVSEIWSGLKLVVPLAKRSSAVK